MDTFSNHYIYPTLDQYKGLKYNFPIINPETYVGLELEIENVHFPSKDLPYVWRATDDHSLKNNGIEFVSVPIRCKYLEIELKRLFDFLPKTIEYSQRCSVHIHLNVRDLTLEELKVLVLAYMVSEKLLYKYSGNRWENLFCVPLTEYPQQARQLINMKSLKETEGFAWYKYSGLNLSPIWGGRGEHSTRNCIGTAEFRHMKGNNDIEYILSWINLITSLKSYAKTTPLELFIEKLKKLNTDSSYYVLMEDIFGAGYNILNPTKEELESCITIAKSCIKNKSKERIEV